MNFPVEAKFLKNLVEDQADLRLMFPQADPPFNEEQWLAKMDPGANALSLKVRIENKVVGHFAFLRIDKSQNQATLGFVYLAPALRRTGTSMELMSLAERLARDLLSLQNMLLNVSPSNPPALYLYIKCGYKEYERSETHVRMRKTLRV